MKRYLALCLILIMIVTICGCGKKESTSSSKSSITPTVSASPIKTDTASTNVDNNTLVPEKQGGDVTVDVTPPTGWTPVEGSVLPVQYMKVTASFMVKEEPLVGTTIDDAVNQALDIYKQAFDGFKVLGQVESLKVDEKDARKAIFTCNLSGIAMKYYCIYLFVADKTYVITFADLESSFDSLATDYETILNTIHFKTE